jgi:hypothetical protein
MKKNKFFLTSVVIALFLASVLSCAEQDESPVAQNNLSSAPGTVMNSSKRHSAGRTDGVTFDGSEGDPIDLQTAQLWTANYRTQNPEELFGHYFGADIIHQILGESGCVGIRIYYAIDEKGERKLLIVGVDAQGNDLLPIEGAMNGEGNTIADFSYPCPNMCPPDGSL